MQHKKKAPHHWRKSMLTFPTVYYSNIDRLIEKNLD